MRLPVSATVATVAALTAGASAAPLALPALVPAAAAAAAVVSLALGLPAPVAAQGYPTRPIRLVMPNAPGSSTDTLGRIMVQGLSEELGQRVVIDNRPGAGGTLGMQLGKLAIPDGYTIVFGSPAALTVAPFVQRTQPYEPLKDFEFITTIGVTPNVLIVNSALPANTVAELIALARARKGELNMASAGPGSQSHLAGALLLSLGGFDSLHVPFKGGAAVPSVMSGESHWSINPGPSVMQMLKMGKVKAIAHTLPQRTPLLPDMPAIAETVPGYNYSAWNGVIAPLRTPSPVLKRLHRGIAATMERPEIKSQMAGQATEILITAPAQFREMVRETIEHNLKMIKALNLSVDR